MNHRQREQLWGYVALAGFLSIVTLVMVGCTSSTEPGQPVCSAPDTTWAATGETVVVRICVGRG